MPDKPENPDIWVVFDEVEQKWEVRRQDADKPIAAFEKKEDAVRKARRIAQREHGELTVTKEDQEIEDHDSFARSPDREIKIVKPDEIDVSGTVGGPLSLDEPLREATDRSDEPLEPGSLGLPGEPRKR